VVETTGYGKHETRMAGFGNLQPGILIPGWETHKSPHVLSYVSLS
jgi:hypothetical protein